jgi:GNAT superfamily N-acetyltransferase
VPELLELIAEHAAYEKAVSAPGGSAANLSKLLFSDPARLHALVADTPARRLVGYATWSLEVSTWQATEYAHIDCLYLRERARGFGIGQQLIAAVADEARRAGAREVQWQTPDWNDGAIRFYERLGAHHSSKQRFTLLLAP